MARLYLVRHGSHDALGKMLAGRMSGLRLSDTGLAQAQRLAPWFESRGVSALLSSPLERCRETAAAIAARLGLSVTIRDDLDELDCGAWTGLSFTELAEDPAWRRWNEERAVSSTPGGESAKAMQVRAMGLVTRLARDAETVTVAVTHSDLIKTVVLTLLGASLDRHDVLVIDPASITTLDLWPGGGKVVRSNEVPA